MCQFWKEKNESNVLRVETKCDLSNHRLDKVDQLDYRKKQKVAWVGKKLWLRALPRTFGAVVAPQI